MVVTKTKSILRYNEQALVYLPPTEVANNILVLGDRKNYLYGDSSTIYAIKEIEDFLVDILSLAVGVTRDKLVEFTHIPRTTLYEVLKNLIDQGIVRTMFLHDGKSIGRPKTVFLV